MKEVLQSYLDSQTPDQLRAEIDKRKRLQCVDINDKLVPISNLPWWKKDKNGWPIETFKGQPLSSLIRIVCQNIRKVIG